jgi:hypothetical protein
VIVGDITPDKWFIFFLGRGQSNHCAFCLERRTPTTTPVHERTKLSQRGFSLLANWPLMMRKRDDQCADQSKRGQGSEPTEQLSRSLHPASVSKYVVQPTAWCVFFLQIQQTIWSWACRPCPSACLWGVSGDWWRECGTHSWVYIRSCNHHVY